MTRPACALDILVDVPNPSNTADYPRRLGIFDPFPHLEAGAIWRPYRRFAARWQRLESLVCSQPGPEFNNSATRSLARSENEWPICCGSRRPEVKQRFLDNFSIPRTPGPGYFFAPSAGPAPSLISISFDCNSLCRHSLKFVIADLPCKSGVSAFKTVLRKIGFRKALFMNRLRSFGKVLAA